MTDDAFLEKAKLYISNYWALTPEELARLIALARIGAAVKPRPISEAPKDGSRFLARTIERPPWSEIRYRWEEAWWSKNYFASVSGASPECFIPLSALPTRTTGAEMKDIKRMWINQPSTLQPLHHMHGTNVIATPENDPNWVRIFPLLPGDTISMRVSSLCLSPGWREGY